MCSACGTFAKLFQRGAVAEVERADEQLRDELGVKTSAANVHDSREAVAIVDAIAAKRKPKNLCMDKGLGQLLN